MGGDWLAILQAATLLVLVHGAPILARDLLGRCCAWPVDFGLRFTDGRPLLGHSKTWRGLLSAILAGALFGDWLGIGAGVGAGFGFWAMLGDGLTSFVKRRMGLEPSARFRGLDQWPESLLPLWLLREPLGLDVLDILLAVVLFTLFEWWVSPLLYRLHLRNRPW